MPHKTFLAITAAVFLMIFSITVFAAEEPPGAATSDTSTATQMPEATQESIIGIDNLVGEIAVPEKAARVFNDLYYRHKTELYQMLENNPYMIWQTLGLVSDSLPALRSMAKGKGNLHLDVETYSKANNLYNEYLGLASPDLAANLRKVKRYIDQRTKTASSGNVIIDLNE